MELVSRRAPQVIERFSRIQTTVGGTVITTEREVLDAAEPIDRGVSSLGLDMASHLYSDPARGWDAGCRAGFDDAYVAGYQGLSGVGEPHGPPAYVAAYRRAFSTGTGFTLGLTAKKLGKPTPRYQSNEDPAAVRENFIACQFGFAAWLNDHPQQKPPMNVERQNDLQSDFFDFGEVWRPFYLSLHDIGTLESGDTYMAHLRSYYRQYKEFVGRYEAMGFKASFVAPPPPEPESNALNDIASAVGTIAKWSAVAALGYVGWRVLS